ncbi:MazG nucleotide pyrophosphohydrolase domain-containing protein [Rhizobium sp. S96]|uniref:MazG nucleotide pyrophosphohydrolase domain-containing protein n=1 Tax=Rhizobium sp. S96 TaxID=3055140 RepID=UPI0025AB001F|nr:MazG nucleotide pyrophosphohydrolase domain-containing protein [Rhizobium sp. S96]MDM9619111.1 MazG nucleotide pyrophosphohydrolase domain-containing protein [Rhizobium sp. S96]
MTDKLFVIRKGGYYYRPNAQGYTASLHEAGRYPEAEAIAHMDASDPGDITIFPAPAVPLSLTLPKDIAATAEVIALEHIAGAMDMDTPDGGAHLERLAVAIATALEAERLRASTPAPIPLVMGGEPTPSRPEASSTTTGALPLSYGSPPADLAEPMSPAKLVMGLSIAELQRAHIERQEEWCPDQKPDLSFRGNELGGECGEAQNVIKKLERERHGWRGSRDTVEHLAEELGDVIHCAVLCAITAGIDLEPAVIAKFNSTSEKNGLATMLRSALSAVEGSEG